MAQTERFPNLPEYGSPHPRPVRAGIFPRGADWLMAAGRPRRDADPGHWGRNSLGVAPAAAASDKVAATRLKKHFQKGG